MERGLTERLKWCKRELSALKTAQNVGLGLVDFYSSTSNTNYKCTGLNDSNFLITIQFSQELSFRPYCEAYLDAYLNGEEVFSRGSTTFDLSNKQLKIRYVYISESFNQNINTYVKVVSVVPIFSITMEAISPDD